MGVPPAGLFFLGSRADADATLLNEVEAWRRVLPDYFQRPFVTTIVVNEMRSIMDVKNLESRLAPPPAAAKEYYIGSRLIPRDFVLNHKESVKKILKTLARKALTRRRDQPGAWRYTEPTWNYVLGGAVTDVADNATAVNPGFRSALWQMIVLGPEEDVYAPMLHYLRANTPGGSVGYNHAAKDEPDWESAMWGSNTPRLNAVKKKYDPDNRFNCFHCVGYQYPSELCNRELDVDDGRRAVKSQVKSASVP